ncbi:MAG TPA: alkaline phosphatase family protein [Pyrinomonadaceae bacterium]|nr:alkaline phosphatase family protein [Pyrinomonadaceae bacterium]
MTVKNGKIIKFFLLVFLLAGVVQTVFGQSVKRVIIIKADGLPMYYVDRYVKMQDPATGKSKLPWIDEVFYKNGTRLENFYVRGMSLSAPSWSILDTGQHLQIKGNVEFDRDILSTYYYLNFIPFQIDYGLKKRVDMPGVEMLDRLKIPLLVDAFPYRNRVIGYQLYQRDNRWDTFIQAFANTFPLKWQDLVDEYTLGFNFRDAPTDQVEKDLINYLSSRPYVDYMDYFSSNFDHTAHHLSDDYSKFKTLQGLDRVIGRIWTAIQNSSRANETALFLVSDHGTNSEDGIYSQGFNLIRLLGSANGGGHHVITKRRPMGKYGIIPEIPLFPVVTSESKESAYLKGESGNYPTALLDFDGNERSSLYFRDNDLNLLHLLLKQLQNKKLAKDLKPVVTDAFFDVLNRRREEWQAEISQMQDELAASNRLIESQEKTIETFPKKYTPEELENGIDRENVRLIRLNSIAVREYSKYQEYLRVMSNLVSLRKENFEPNKLKIEDYIAKQAMGSRNSIYKLQNYVVGLSANGLVKNENGELDFEKSFRRVNYPELLQSQKVINNVQKELSNRPIDFVSTTIPLNSIVSFLPKDVQPNIDPIWCYGGADKQALILTRKDADGKLTIRYLPIANLKQREDGDFEFQIRDWSEGFPLKIFEDSNLNVSGDKAAWLSQWHTELEWLNAVHKTTYSNGIIGLTEQQNEQTIAYFADKKDSTPDEKLLQRLTLRQRQLVRPDLLVMANNHWNFDVAGFNPGGNHGSFFRVSTNSTFMMAGGKDTNIPHGLNITTPYDSLSFTPTVLALTGKVDKNGNPTQELYKKGFRKFPGRIVSEVFENK